MQEASFGRRTTSAIKGIALILMFVHHFFAYPEWYVEGISYPELAGYVSFFRYSMKICVPAFAFLTGYFYTYARNKTLRYSLRKMTDVLVSYWTVFFPLLLFALIGGYRGLSAFGFAMGVFGRNISLMTFCWYVSFYCLAMLLLPLLTRSGKPSLIRDAVRMVIAPVVLCTILEKRIGSDTVRTMIEEIRLWFPCVASGYLCSKYGAFEAAEKFLSRKAPWASYAVYALCILAAIAGRYCFESFGVEDISFLGEGWSLTCTMDVFYAPAFVYGVSMLLRRIESGHLVGALKRIGDKSLLMWYLHCIFFNVSNEITQRVLYWPGHPALVVMFGLALCYAAATIISPAERRLVQLKNRAMDRLWTWI